MAGNHGCFEEWLGQFEKDFLSLNDMDKNLTIMRIIELSGPVQLQLFSSQLEVLVKRDFLKCLPPELTFHVMKWLDYETLCRCCLISKTWNKVISNCNKAWMSVCEELGVVHATEQREKEIECSNWKLKFVTAIQKFRRLSDVRTFTTRKLYGHTARVFALHYKDGLLASGSDDRTLRLWDLSSGHCLHLLSCHTCADVKFDSKVALTASFDNTLALWEWSSGNCLVKYQGHVGAVFCVDYDEKLDLVVSGSSDCTVKFWQMSTGSCLVTKLGHDKWVNSVLLRKVHPDYQTKLKQEYIVISMDKTYIKIWSTSISENFCIGTLSCSEETPGLLRPRLLCNGKDILCSSDHGICIWNLATLQLTRFTTHHSLWLVALGEIFCILLDMDHLYIINNKTEQRVAEVPLSRIQNSLSGSRFRSCEVAWLDDCSTLHERGVIFAMTASDLSIYIIEWNDASAVIANQAGILLKGSTGDSTPYPQGNI